MIIDLSLSNSILYAGCEIEEVAGRLNLTTPVVDAVNIAGRNINYMMKNVGRSEVTEVTSERPDGRVVVSGRVPRLGSGETAW